MLTNVRRKNMKKVRISTNIKYKYSTEMMRLKNTNVLTNKRGQKQIRSKRKDQ